MRKMSLAGQSVLLIALGYAMAAGASSSSIVVVDTSGGCFHCEGGTHELALEGELYRLGTLNVSPQEVADVQDMILQSGTNKQTLLNYLGVTEEWFHANQERLTMNSLKSHWAKKYPTFDQLPSDAQNMIDFTGTTNLVLRELAEGDEIGSTTEVTFSVTFPGDPELKICSMAERPGMLPFHVSFGTNTWKTYDPAISAALQKFALMTGPNYIHLNIRRPYGKEGWKPSKYNDVLKDRLDIILCKETYKAMPGYELIQDTIEITRPSSGNLINMEPRSMILSLNIKNTTYIDRAWCWAHITDEGEPKDSWIEIMELIQAADEAVKDHIWLREWRNRSSKRHIQLLISGAKPRIGSKSFENAALKRIKHERTPHYMLYLRKGNHVTGKIFVGSEDNSVALYDWKKSKTEPWLDRADFPLGSVSYALVSPEGKVTIK